MSSALPNPQVGQTTQTVGSNLANGVIVVPFIAQVAAGASGEIAMLKTSAVSITGIDEIFDYTASVASAVKILNTFTITDADENADTLVDSSGANVIVSRDVNDEEAFKEALREALADASSNNEFNMVGYTDASSFIVNPQEYLEIECYRDTLRHLKYDTIANLLTASDLYSFNVVLDISGGAKNMYEAIGGDSDTATAYRKTLFTQISEDRLESYLRPSAGEAEERATLEGKTTLDFLPLRNGDKLVFVFDATVGEAGDTDTGLSAGPNTMPTSGAKLNRVTVDALPASGLANVNSAAGITSLSSADNLSNGVTLSAPTKRRFAIRITLGDDEAGKPFNVKDLSNNDAVFDPSNNDFADMIAAGLLAEDHGLELTADAVPAGAAGAGYTLEIDASAGVWADVSGLDPSGGEYVEVQIAELTEPTLASGVVGAWLVKNTAGNKNTFVVDGANIKYRARMSATDDTATVHYVTNVGLVAYTTINSAVAPAGTTSETVSASAGIGPAPEAAAGGV